MEKECWNAIMKHYKLLYTHIDVAELVSYLKVPLTQYANDLDKISTSSIYPQEYREAKHLLSYLKHVPNSFDIICKSLVECCQEFLSDSLRDAVEEIIETDSPIDIIIADCRKPIFDSIIRQLFEGHQRINIYGQRGVGTSWFAKQILHHLTEEYYFKIYTINAISTPLPLQREHIKQYLEEISELQSYEKKFSIIWFDNIDTEKVRKDTEGYQKYQEYQKKIFDELVTACQKKEISCIFTSRNEYPNEAGTDMINHHLHCLDDRKDLTQIIKAQFPHFTSSQRDVILALGQKNPLDIILASSLYCLCDLDTDTFLCCYSPVILDYCYNDQTNMSRDSRTFRKLTIDHNLDNMSASSLNGSMTSVDLIKLIFKKLSKEMTNIIIVLCSIRCECKVTEAFISYIISQDQPTVRFYDETLRDVLLKLSTYRLLDIKDDVVSISTNVYFLFREHFSTLSDISNKRYLYYIRYCKYYLDYAEDVLNMIELSSLSNEKEKEWQDNMCTIAAVLNPPDSDIEKDIIERKLYEEHSKLLYEKRVSVVNRLQQVDLNFPDNELIFAIDFLLNGCVSLSSGKKMDRFTLLCNLTKLFLNSSNVYNIENAHYAAIEAKMESDRLKKSNKALKSYLYLELLYNILEIQWKDNKQKEAEATLGILAKILKSSKFKNQRGMRRSINLKLAELKMMPQSGSLSRNKSLAEAITTTEDGSDTMTNFIDTNQFFGDSYYKNGDLHKAFKYYFAMFTTITDSHMYLEVQETICWTLGHLCLQKGGKLSVKELDKAIEFYEQAEKLYIKRKKKKKNYITLFIATAYLLRGIKPKAKELLYSILRTNDNFKFFFALIDKDTQHVPSWDNLTPEEKKHISNKAPRLPVNFVMLEEAHYSSQYESLAKEDDPLFIEGPSDNLSETIDNFNCDEVQSWTENNKRLVVYCTITSAPIAEPNHEVTFTPKLKRKNVIFARPRTYTF